MTTKGILNLILHEDWVLLLLFLEMIVSSMNRHIRSHMNMNYLKICACGYMGFFLSVVFLCKYHNAAGIKISGTQVSTKGMRKR